MYATIRFQGKSTPPNNPDISYASKILARLMLATLIPHTLQRTILTLT